MLSNEELERIIKEKKVKDMTDLNSRIKELPEDVFYDLYPYFKDESKLISSDSYCKFINLFKPKKPKEQQERDHKILSKLFQKQYDILLNIKIIRRYL
ncbi:MAG: hypothetical protein U9R23_04885 [Candidatus Cloacimonadota bacterium]|nr:hypothetical protein [Candidatus Cloacimonadota bacterium]